MAIRLTDAAEAAAQKTQIEPQLVLEIEGLDTKIGAVIIFHRIRVGDTGLLIGTAWTIGGLAEIEDQQSLISLESGTTTKINQQLQPDQGAISSISSMAVRLVDKDLFASKLISPGILVTELLFARATLSMGFQHTSFPEDYVRLFNGFIDQIDSGPGWVQVNIAAPDQKKRQNIFPKVVTNLSSRLEFNSVIIQNINYSGANGRGTEVSIAYVDDAPEGMETVTVSGDAVTVHIHTAGLHPTNANKIRSVINSDSTANALVFADVISHGTTPQVAVGATNLQIGTTIFVENAEGFLRPYLDTPTGLQDPATRFYVLIGDEIIEYTDISGNTFTGIVRASLDTVSQPQAVGTDVTSFYALEDNSIDMALKVMLSGVQGNFVESVPIEAFDVVSPILTVPNTLFFKDLNVQDVYGLTEGDYVTTTGALNGANNVTLKQITSITVTDEGNSYLGITGVSFVDETMTAATVSFRSQYDTLPDGLQMDPRDVDVSEHLRWQSFALSAYNLRFYLKDTVNGKDFIEKQIYAPIGAYSLPRKGRSSMGYTTAPIPSEEIKFLNQTNITRPGSIILKRSTNRNFYNTIVYKYEQDSLLDKFLAGVVTDDEDSKNRIKTGTKTFTIEAAGIRKDLDGTNLVIRASQQRLGRYRFAAEYFEGVQTLFRTGFNIECGDIPVLEFEGLQVTNTLDGTRSRISKFYEVVNKSLDLKTGEVTLNLVDTTYSNDERYGVISPSSLIAQNGGTTSVIIQDSFGAKYPGNEKKKWEDYLGLPVIIHSEDYSFSEEVTLVGFNPANPYEMRIDTLSIPAVAGWIIDIGAYPDSTDARINNRYKLAHCFWSPRVDVVTGVSDLEFTVSSGDALKFVIGNIVELHLEDFTVRSGEVKVASIVGTTITVSGSLGFTPDSTYKVSFIGFADGGESYRWI